jgi:hypothetical protein
MVFLCHKPATMKPSVDRGYSPPTKSRAWHLEIRPSGQLDYYITPSTIIDFADACAGIVVPEKRLTRKIF